MEGAFTLDQILLSQPRLLIMSLLKNRKSAEFIELRDQLKIAPGNLSLQVKKLKEAGYIEIVKSYRENYPLTTCKLTEKGEQSLMQFQKSINDLLG